MVKIRLLRPFSSEHERLPVGEVIGVHKEKADRLVVLGYAEYVEPVHAVIEPQERRVGRPRKQRDVEA